VSIRWFERPETAATVLRESPRLASWDRWDDPDQIRLRKYLDDTLELVDSARVAGLWALRLDVGLPMGRDLSDMADLDNYVFPLAGRLRDENLVSVWCTKLHADTSTVRVAPAHQVAPPASVFMTRTTASSATKEYKHQVRNAVVEEVEIPGGPVWLQVAFAVSPRRNWLNLWKPTIDALDPLLGRTLRERDWHPRDGRITELGLHVTTEPELGNDVIVALAAGPAAAPLN
jgi:hypothetical protein